MSEKSPALIERIGAIPIVSGLVAAGVWTWAWSAAAPSEKVVEFPGMIVVAVAAFATIAFLAWMNGWGGTYDVK